jgi:lipopolysaccharide export system protein LptA
MKRTKQEMLCGGILLALLLMAPSWLLAEDAGKRGLQPAAEEIVVNSDSLEVDNKRKIVTFSGNVNASREDFTINCDKMSLHYYDTGEAQGEADSEVKIDRIIAVGKVKISRADGGSATADKAIYYQKDEKVVLTGKPIVKQGQDLVQGAKITLFLKENRSIVEGGQGSKVKAVISPRSADR